MTNEIGGIYTVRQLTERNQQRGTWPDKERSLRHLIQNADKNGFNHCVRRAGRRVLIDEGAFYEWLSQPQENAA